MRTFSNRIPRRLTFLLLLAGVLFSACSTISPLPPEVNLMRLEVQEVTLSHINLLADLRVFNPNETALTVQGVDYTLEIEGIRVFSGNSRMNQSVEPQTYSNLNLRLSSAYWDIIRLLNSLPDKTDVSFSMQGDILVGPNRLYARRFSFARQGVIPFQKVGP